MPFSVTDWLNSLGSPELEACYTLMCSMVGTTHTSADAIFGWDDVQTLSAAPSCHSGRFWSDWVTCYVVNLDASSGHPRWQIRLRAHSGSIPSADSAGGRLRGLLSAASWDALQRAPAQVKVPCHHLAVRASGAHPELPNDLGHGSSISHLCDRTGCIRKDHLEVEEVHETNLVRQRCRGVTLVVYNHTIVCEVPCPHDAIGAVMAIPFAASCRKLSVLSLGDREATTIFQSLQTVMEAVLSSGDMSSGRSYRA
jgi:hypothetical protein